MPEVTSSSSSTPLFYILNGQFAEKVPEGTPNAVSRVNKNNETVHEVYRKAWRGIVKDWQIRESEFQGKKFKSLLVMFDDATISLSGKMMSEFIKKFAGAKQDEEITVSPYPEFVGKDGITKKAGLTIYQNDQRLYSFFSEYDQEKKTYVSKNGFPDTGKQWNDMSEKECAIYFLDVEEFLDKWVDEHPINNIGAKPAPKEGEIPTIQISEIPF